MFPAKQAKKKRKEVMVHKERRQRLTTNKGRKTLVSSVNLKEPTMPNFQRKVARYKAVQIHKELGEVFLQFSRDKTLNNTETCSVYEEKMLVQSLW